MKILTGISFFLFVFGVGAFLAQMWVQPWHADIFMKIMITDGALLAIFVVLAFLVRENRASDRIHNSKLD